MNQLFDLIISKIDWSHDNFDFKKQGIPYNENTKKYYFTNGARGIKMISEYLNTKLKEI
ncbi:hypothetical protein D3C72_2503770 [compost metagenome]